MINSFANWFAAFGSFAAAGIALYLANRAAKPSVRVSVGHRITIAQGDKPPYPEFVAFRVVNTGDRPVTISNLGWKVGFWKKRYALQMYDRPMSSPMPVQLTHGQEATWYVPLHARQEEPWLEYFAKGMLCPNYRSAVWTLRAQFFSSVGHVFEVRPEQGLLVRLKATCKKLTKRES